MRCHCGQITVSGLVENNVITVGVRLCLLTQRSSVAMLSVSRCCCSGKCAQVYGNITEMNSSNISTVVASAFQGIWMPGHGLSILLKFVFSL